MTTLTDRQLADLINEALNNNEIRGHLTALKRVLQYVGKIKGLTKTSDVFQAIYADYLIERAKIGEYLKISSYINNLANQCR